MRDELRFHVEVDRVDLHVLERSIGAFAQFVRAAGNGRWIVSDLELGSVTAAARPAAGLEMAVEFDRIVAGFDLLAEIPQFPTGWNDDLLSSVAGLRRLADTDGVGAIEFTFGDRPALTVSPVVISNAEVVLDSGPSTLGAVTGKVDRFYDRDGRRDFGLVDEATGAAVTVRFTREWENEALNWVGKRVTAWGTLRRTPGGKKRELRMEGMEFAHLEADEPLRIDDVVGLLGPEWTDGTNSVDWVRRQRGDG